MAGQLLPLRLLSSSRIVLSARVAVAFRLKTLDPVSSPNHLTYLIGSSGGRGFSTRNPMHRDGGRSGLRSTRAAAPGGHAKSLIEDEAELSDWVSDLKTDSFRLGLSDSDADDSGDRKRGGRRNERDDRVSRGRDSGGFSDRRTSRGGGGVFLERGSLSKRRGTSDEEYEGGWRSPRSSSGLRNSRGSGGFSERSHRGPPTKRRFASELEDEDDEEEEEKEEFLSRQSRGQGVSSSFGKRGARAGESSYKQGRASLQQTEEEEEEEDEDNDGDSDGTAFEFDDDFFGKKESEQKKGKQDLSVKSSRVSDLSDWDNKQPVSASSSEDSSSYLSNTR